MGHSVSLSLSLSIESQLEATWHPGGTLLPSWVIVEVLLHSWRLAVTEAHSIRLYRYRRYS